MSVKVIVPDEALLPGSDLWIFPELEFSKWTREVDWYLNFQITRSLQKEPAHLSNTLTDLISQTGLEVTSNKAKSDAPFMIASQDLLPNKWVIVLPWKGHLSTWSIKSSEIWRGLGCPTLRFFLPTGQTAKDFEREWKKYESLDVVSIVLD